ncbi:glycosyltransferase [Lapidilactobacillus dextrinicus DSM 20335]|uniref:Glycosyltransferase n=1 Tax=Lapidilactobacillus dextrinicus DSM 20335 TaxID=1423738 RepID=A0A0R2BF07_9LACO|nr:glycosyltransferase [Lapidilactobacillus dextrinicus]KRM78173.1 glycosyltransferase [Lapidilactobacillus dextrinicus DSM 20335]QFG47134.1 glycosyltransferase family 4 protein [Lapidilactobacillus dextrinicus]
MKIAIISPQYGFGGSNIVAATVGKELEKKDSVIYIAYEKDKSSEIYPIKNYYYVGIKHSKISLACQKTLKGISYILRGSFNPEKYVAQEIHKINNLIKNNKIDVVVLNSYQSVSLFAKSLKRNNPNLKILSWLHESVDYCKNVTRNYRKYFIESLKCSDKIICLSKESVQYYHQYSETQLIYNPISLPEHGISSLKNPVISFTARLNVQVKGLDYLCQVAQQLPDPWKIHVAGQGTEKEIDALNNLIIKYQVEDKIVFVGPKIGRELIKHYQNSSIFISTSRTEALPLVMIEALSFGLPIVSFNHSGAQEILSNGNYGKLVAVGNIDKMSQEINTLINSFEQRLFFQKKSLQRFSDFKTPHIMDIWEKVLQETISQGRPDYIE